MASGMRYLIEDFGRCDWSGLGVETVAFCELPLTGILRGLTSSDSADIAGELLLWRKDGGAVTVRSETSDILSICGSPFMHGRFSLRMGSGGGSERLVRVVEQGSGESARLRSLEFDESNPVHVVKRDS
jgi:hypothetical protein